MDEVTEVDAHNLILSPGSPSTDGKQGTGMQITAIVEARLHHEPMDKVIPVGEVMNDGVMITSTSYSPIGTSDEAKS